jgi:hypothetical protein
MAIYKEDVGDETLFPPDVLYLTTKCPLQSEVF